METIFEKIGQFAVRRRWPVIISWVALAVVITLAAPSIEEATTSDVGDLLPVDAPFARAEAILRQTFPDLDAAGSAVIVLETQGQSIREAATWDYLTELTGWLQSDVLADNMLEVLSPAGGTPLLADALVSSDNELALINLRFKADPQNAATVETLRQIRRYLAENTPDGVQPYLTGAGPIITGYVEATMESIDRTTVATVLLVALILVGVYRSPVSPFVPLITVGVAYLISRGLVAWIGANLMTISSYANAMMIVIIFGAGTDYCLFLISRFGEELEASRPSPQNDRGGVKNTVQRVGEVLTSSASTVVVGFVVMAFAEMGLFRTTGPALALGVIVVLLAGLTLTPALLAVMGRRAFWPRKHFGRAPSRYYNWLSNIITRYPIPTIIVIILALGPLALYATEQPITYNFLADLPADNEANIGLSALERHLGGGQMQPVNAVIRNLNPDTALADIADWTARLSAVEGVADVRSLSDPLGGINTQLTNITRISHQLTLASDALNAITESGLPADALTAENIQLASGVLPLVRDYLDRLPAVYPQLAADADLTALRAGLNRLPMAALSGGLADLLPSLAEHLNGLAQTVSTFEPAYYLPEALPDNLVEALGSDVLTALTARYLTADRTAAQFEIILEGNPFGDEAMNTIVTLRQLIPNGEESLNGYPVKNTDLRDTMQRDTLRTVALVTIGIFIVLVLLLRALVAPVYMIAGILLGYGAAMGIMRIASTLVFGTGMLTWWAPFFMFVILVALGIDYNIFLMGRVREEAASFGTREGVHRAVAAVGSIIASAGIIMAGTFSALMSSTILGLVQLGFAVAVGVLLDVFIIRAALVPAIAVLLGRWSWWPGRLHAAETPASGGLPARAHARE